MNRIFFPTIFLSLLLGASSLAQSTPHNTNSTPPATPPAPSNAANFDWFIVGHGTNGFIPLFVAPFKIALSNISQSPSGNIGIGITAPLFPLHVFSSNTLPPPGHNQPVTLWVETSAFNTQGAIQGLASSLTGNTIAINGATFSPDGIGVLGNHTSNDGGGNGVVGLTNSISGFSTGVTGGATGSTGPSVGVFGTVQSPEGVAGLFDNVAGGDILRGGTQQPVVDVFRVDGTGRVFADGGFQPNGADFAESMSVLGRRANYGPGDLLVIDQSGIRRLAISEQPYSTLVAGIYSTKPGMLGSTRSVDAATPYNEVPLALVGIVPCKVSAENGPIHVGDLLVTSSTLGHAMRGSDRSRMLGAVVGKALEPLRAGTGTINVLVTLQ